VSSAAASPAAAAPSLRPAPLPWGVALAGTAALVVAASVPIVLAVRAGRGSARAALAPLALLVVATALREADVRRVLCWPDSALYQGHALWHLLCAAWRFLANLPGRR